jgi:hypothetical protein
MQPLLRRCALALGVLAGLCVLTGTASASVPGIVRADAVSDQNSFSPKAVLATCPAGKQVVGTGGRITGGLGQVAMNEIIPLGNLRQVSVVAEERAGGSPNSWKVEAFAMCADPLPGLNLQRGTRASGIFTEAIARAACPAGQKVYGVGGRVTGAPAGTVMMTGMQFPSSTLADVRAQETPAGTSASWSVDSFALCAAPLAGRVQATNFSAVDSLSTKTRGIGCPPGKNLLGGAGFTVGGGEVALDDLLPTPTGFTATAFEDADGFAGFWILEAAAVCA